MTGRGTSALRSLSVVLITLGVLYLAVPASALPGGISGRSGNPATNGGSTCTSCHSTGAAPTVTISGPTSVNSGSTNSYTLAVVNGVPNGGLDVSATAGTLAAGSGTQILNAEVTHTAPRTTTPLSWTFSWTAPTVTANTTATLYGAAISGGFGGGTGRATLPVTVLAPAAPNLNVTPTSLSYTFQIGGANPAAQNVSVTSSGSALNFTTSASATWLSASPASGSTPGTVAVSVNPSGLAAGTYNGTVTIAAPGAANTPRTVAVQLTVTPAAAPNLVVSPASLSFAFTIGGANPAAQNVSVTSSGSALNFTTSASATWLSASPASGSTPGTVAVSVNPSGLAAGTYNGTVTIAAPGAANTPRTVSVQLTVASAGTGGTLAVTPSRLLFFVEEEHVPAPQTITVTSTGSPLSFTAATFGGSWLSVTPAGGTTPARLNVSVHAAGLAAGTYSGVVRITAGTSTRSVAVILVVESDEEEEGGDAREEAQVRPFTFDPRARDTVSAAWVNGAGIPGRSRTDASNQGLRLARKSSAPAAAIAGATLKGGAGKALKELGFDLRDGSVCTATAPQLLVVTADDTTHVAGCATGSSSRLSAAGWRRLRFNPAAGAQFAPALKPGMTVKTIALILDRTIGKGVTVLDNINLNGVLIGRQ